MSQNQSKQRQTKPRAVKREQPRKDSSTRRVNYDNERESKFDKQMRKDSKSNECNDVAWYAGNEMLLKAAASLPYARTTGHRIAPSVPFAAPGVFIEYWTPVLEGQATQAAMNSQYSFVVHANSRNESYDAPDMFYMELAGMNVFCALGAATRIYGLARTYSGENAYLPDYLITAHGVDPKSVRANLSQVWFDINQLIAQSQQIWIPNTLPLLNRWFWLNSNVYQDAEGVRSQKFMFIQDNFYKLDEKSSEYGTSLVKIGSQRMSYRVINNQLMDWATFKGLIQEMIDALVASQDRGIIFGDILKAYSAERIFALNPIPSDYVTPMVYNAEVLSQIENSTIFNTEVQRMYQNDAGEIKPQFYAWTQNQVQSFAGIAANELVLNMHTTAVTEAQNMVATRLMTAGLKRYDTVESGGTVAYRIGPAVHGTEIVTKAISNWVDYSTGVGVNQIVVIDGRLSSAATVESVSKQMYCWCACDWAPTVYAIADDYELPSQDNGVYFAPQVNWVFCDFDNYTTVNATTLEKMHTTALYSLLDVPNLQ